MRIQTRAAVFLILGLVFAAATASVAEANPRGLSVGTQTCTASGSVETTLTWTPDSSGQQFVNLATRNDGFRSSYSTSGPYTISQTQVRLVSLQPNTTYYVRVTTRQGTQAFHSTTLSFTTQSCAAAAPSSNVATAPTHFTAAAISTTGARFQWLPGKNNRFFCIDYARSLPDLVNKQNTWRNSGCGNTTNSHVVNQLACGTTYFARVWTPAGGGLYSQVRNVTTQDCSRAITPPTALRVIYDTHEMARVAWSPGRDNRWFCVDTAKRVSHLTSLSGTWRNHGCWTTATELTLTGLTCETTYYWRVYTWNSVTNAHSDVSTFQTDLCGSKLVRADILDVDVEKRTGGYRVEIEGALPDSCHSFGSYQVVVDDNLISVTVWNLVATGETCTDTPDESYTLALNLGNNFTSGVRYTVEVNKSESVRFIAQ